MRRPALWFALGLAALLIRPASAAAVRIEYAGADTMQALVARWGRAFEASHPRAIVRVDPRTRLSADGFEALIAGRVDCVTFAREMLPAEIAAYEAHFGLRPRLIPVAGGSFATPHATHAIAIYVNAANPLIRLSTDELGAVFADSPRTPTTWGQLGAQGPFGHAPIHVYGTMPYRASGNPPGIVNYLRDRLLAGREFRRDVRSVDGSNGNPPLQAIVRRIAADPDGIGYSGFGFALPGVRALAIAPSAGARAVAGTRATVTSRRYPLVRTVYLLFSPRPAPAPLAGSFARFALSPRGQALVPRDRMHFIALTRAERTRALAALRRASTRSTAAKMTHVLPAYAPRAVPFPQGAGYVRPDGAIAIVGYNDMRDSLAAIDILFSASHPGYRFSLNLQGTRTAPAALTAGTSLFAPMGARFEDEPLAAYRLQVGADPLRIRIAHDALDPAARSSPLAVFVHGGNPLASLTLAELGALFAPPAGAQALARWGQVIPQASWRARPVHLYGPAPKTALGSFLTRSVFGDRGYALGYRGFAESRAVIAQLRGDPDGIAIADLNQAEPGLKVVALARCKACRPSRGTAQDLIGGRYPLDRHLYIYLRRIPSRGIDPLAREYLRLVLSREGQAAIAAAPPHYLPLDAEDAADALAALR